MTSTVTTRQIRLENFYGLITLDEAFWMYADNRYYGTTFGMFCDKLTAEGWRLQ